MKKSLMRKKLKFILPLASLILLFSCSQEDTNVETEVVRKTGDEITLKCVENTGITTGTWVMKIGINECVDSQCFSWDAKNIKIEAPWGMVFISREDLSYNFDFGRGGKGSGMCEIDNSKKAL